MSEAAHVSSDRSFDRKLILALALIAVAVYANSLWNGFAFDDDWIIVRNLRVHQLRDLGMIWGTPYWPSFGTELGLYRPLAIFAYALQWAAADGAPWIYHAVNVVLHALVTVLVFRLVRTFVSALPAAVGALVIAVHPVHTEAVANGVGQAELLAAAGVLAACLLYATRPAQQLRPGPVRTIMIVALYFLSLCVKEASITLPALLVLLDLTQKRVSLGRAQLRTYVAQSWLPFFVMAAAAVLYLAVRADVLGSISGVDAAPSLPFLREQNRVLTAFRAWPEYVRLLFFPMDLSADYLPATILPVESLTPMALLGAFLLAGTVAITLLAPWNPLAAFPAAWFFITILTVSNLFFPIGVVVAERTLYLPSVALAAAVAVGWQELQARWPAAKQRWARIALALIVLVFGVRTVERNPAWKNTIAVLNSIVRDHPESYRVAWLMAEHYWRNGDLDLAAYYWEAALLLWPHDSQLMNEFANFNIARRNWDRAIELLERSRAQHPWVPRTHELLAFSYAYVGRPAEAIQSANEAFRLDGARTILYAIKARAYEEQGRFDRAIGAWRAALRTTRSPRWVHQGMLARAQARFGDTSGALALTDSLARAHARDTVASATLRQVQVAILDGCYGPRGLAGCPDPLQDWSINTERIVRQKVSNSQNVSTVNPPVMARKSSSQEAVSR